MLRLSGAGKPVCGEARGGLHPSCGLPTPQATPHLTRARAVARSRSQAASPAAATPANPPPAAPAAAAPRCSPRLAPLHLHRSHEMGRGLGGPFAASTQRSMPGCRSGAPKGSLPDSARTPFTRSTSQRLPSGLQHTHTASPATFRPNSPRTWPTRQPPPRPPTHPPRSSCRSSAFSLARYSLSRCAFSSASLSEPRSFIRPCAGWGWGGGRAGGRALLCVAVRPPADISCAPVAGWPRPAPACAPRNTPSRHCGAQRYRQTTILRLRHPPTCISSARKELSSCAALEVASTRCCSVRALSSSLDRASVVCVRTRIACSAICRKA